MGKINDLTIDRTFFYNKDGISYLVARAFDDYAFMMSVRVYDPAYDLSCCLLYDYDDPLAYNACIERCIEVIKDKIEENKSGQHRRIYD